ncbi:uncharacterized protein LOC116729604 [Xiphophorus hellerii]|uniref:uncharacterized protein LOC116729604 n=1 Tax=Xiphophorus hellerii TaxID=8084 RepID=UPI0013B3C221|nr:uncharacterized protein LOC116729604 [Xiphophorus hellerii]
MAEPADEKSVEQLKMERTTAKRLLTRLINNITRTHEDMTEEELKDNFNKLNIEAGKVMAANDDLEASLIAEVESKLGEDGDAALTEQQKSDLEKTANECEAKVREIKSLIQETLWRTFGKTELLIALQVAESECEHVATIAPGVGKEAYDFTLSHLKELLKAAKEVHCRWKRWIPHDYRDEIQDRLRGLELSVPKLVSRTAEFINARLKEGEEKKEQIVMSQNYSLPTIKLKPTSLPKFLGNKRDFYRWKRDWEALQKQGEPTGSQEVKKVQLLDSLDDKITRDLRLTSYSSAEDIFQVLENRYGNQTAIAIEIVEELQRIPAVRGHQPRRIVELIQAVEKALKDLSDLGNTGAIKNPLVTKSVETKLPEALKKEWLVYAADKRNAVVPENRFDHLLAFLKDQENIYEQLEQLREEEPSRRETQMEQRHARTKSVKAIDDFASCVVCGDGKHRKRLYFCKQFRTLTLTEKRAAVKKVGACIKCLEIHDDKSYCKPGFLCKNQSCRNAEDPHHYYLCPSAEAKKSNTTQRRNRIGPEEDKGSRKYTEDQEEFLKKLSPDLAKHCRDVFSNTASRDSNTTQNQLNFLMDSGVQELPVLMMLLEVTANAGQKIGTLIDLASDTNYITHKAASRLNLKSEEITLIVHGVGGMKVCVETKRYLLKIRVKTSKGTLKPYQLVCYGLDSIADIHKHVKAKQLKRFFPDVPLDELVRPREISLLISHREGQLTPQRIRVLGNLVLWDGPLGKVVGGTHPELFEELAMTAHTTKTHFARSMRTAAVRYEEVIHEIPQHPPLIHQISNQLKASKTATTSQDFLEWWRWDSIGTACEPKCGGCRCGNCQPGGKAMTLAEERELEVVKEGLTYNEGDSHTDEPHWHARYPWLEDPASLPDNRNAVEATFFRTEKQLAKEPDWKAAYTEQVHDMLQRGAAIKLSEEAINKWNGPVWYVSHLIAPNPHSVTTPVRLVWNSSQKFKGISMNDLLMKGPDVLNQIRAVLLRFREGAYAALGDIKKMYNSVWLEEREVHLHRFIWRDSEDEKVGDYAITRVNIGDKPAGCIAQLAMRETASLPSFIHLDEERQVLQNNSYVDDILTSHNDPDRLKEITENVECILKAGGFKLKPWVFSGQSGRKNCNNKQDEVKVKTMVLPNQMRDEDNKALGLGYIVEEDKLHVMVSINFSKRKKKMRLGQDLQLDQIRSQTPNPLTRRELLSQVSGLYDPVGLVTPAKQKGAILVRKAFQEAKNVSSQVKDTWDLALSSDLREDAINLFEEYTQLSKIQFSRALTPFHNSSDPLAITFSDGSEYSYGAVLYLRWGSARDPIIRLVESKAKLTPLEQKGEAVKAEMCGAVFASRLKKYFEMHSQIKVERWYHLIDSQTVLGAIQRESYGFQSFFANRIGEIQSNTRIQDWWWIPGNQNIADIITRGASPQDLDIDSKWQQGPAFLKSPVEKWPIKSSKQLAIDAKGSIIKLQKKAFIAVTTRTGIKESELKQELPQNQAAVLAKKQRPSISIQNLVDVSRFSSLTRLVKTIVWVWRAAKRFIKKNQVAAKPKWEAVCSRGVISVREREDALRDIFLAAQMGANFPNTTIDRLVVYQDKESGLLVCGGRIQIFREDRAAVPIIPHDAWVSTLLGREAHNAAHDGIAGTLLRMRRKAWVVKGRRIAQKIVDNCMVCKKARALKCQQLMGDLPPERAEPAPPFKFTSVDLFGPYYVRDDVKKRVTIKVWGVVFCCMASRAIHTELASSLSTESFLMAYQRFTAIRGHPQKIWSDAGTNFVGAKPVMEELYRYLSTQNRSDLEEAAAKNGTEWVWKILPADSPHRNGAAEAAVGIVKKAFQSLGQEFTLTFSEFHTILYNAANLANERPIDARIQSREGCIQYITPNSLLLGRASQSGDMRMFDFSSYSFKRLGAMQNEVTKFWKSWRQLAGPNLFVRSKWHTSHRNVAIGDIVWLCDQNALRGQFMLGRVVSANPDKKGVVRDVNVQVVPSYCTPITRHVKQRPTHPPKKDKVKTTILHRDVRRLIVLIPVEEQMESQTKE